MVEALAVAESPLVAMFAVIVVVTLLPSAVAAPPFCAATKWKVDAVFAPAESPAQPGAALNTNAWPAVTFAEPEVAKVTVLGLTTRPAGSAPKVTTTG